MSDRTFLVCGALLAPHVESGTLDLREDVVLEISQGRLGETWPRAEFEKRIQSSDRVIDASHRLVTPGLIDCHTHALFAGSRADEFFSRLSGTSYEEISKQGGGIQKTVERTRAATDENLRSSLFRRLDRFRAFGVTTVEVKTGYGLSLEDELRLLRLIANGAYPVSVIPTFLGAHSLPVEYRARREDYVDLVCEEMIPSVVSEGLSRICDVFCDPIAFDLREAERILEKAKSLGMSVKLHADQLSDSGGAALAAKLGALSADHLDFSNEPSMKELARSETIGVMIPTCNLFLGKKHQPRARQMMTHGMRLAISTDCNPGTSHTENLPLSMGLAATELKMTVDEIWLGVTAHAAKALGLVDRGQIAPGMRADLAIWDTLDPRDIPYAFGSARPTDVLVSGV